MGVDVRFGEDAGEVGVVLAELLGCVVVRDEDELSWIRTAPSSRKNRSCAK